MLLVCLLASYFFLKIEFISFMRYDNVTIVGIVGNMYPAYVFQTRHKEITFFLLFIFYNLTNQNDPHLSISICNHGYGNLLCAETL